MLDAKLPLVPMSAYRIILDDMSDIGQHVRTRGFSVDLFAIDYGSHRLYSLNLYPFENYYRFK